MKNNMFHLVKQNNMPVLWTIIMNAFLMNIPLSLKTNKMMIKTSTIMYSITAFTTMWVMKTKSENSKMGMHSKHTEKMLKTSFILFIMSEILLFTSLFWMYLNNSLSPNMEMGNTWPPSKTEMSDPSMMPLYGTIMLLYSGVMITHSHHMLTKNKTEKMKKSMMKCIMMGIMFLDMQISEYSFSNMIKFSMNDSNYGNSFFSITGTHGSHVTIGLMMLMASFMISKKMSISKTKNSSFEISAWYWHFVDILWLFVYSLIYWTNF